MVERKGIIILAGLVMSVSLLVSSLTALFLSEYYNRAYMQALGQVCQGAIGNLGGSAEAKGAVLEAVKDYTYNPTAGKEEENILLAYGYRQNDFLKPGNACVGLFILAGFTAGCLLFLGTLFFRYRWENTRIRALTDYLEKINTGVGGVLVQNGEDEFSRLQDEIYKTVTTLHCTRDAAVCAKNNFAENLYNIAHQIKTPITSISLSLQLIYSDILSEQFEKTPDIISEQNAMGVKNTKDIKTTEYLKSPEDAKSIRDIKRTKDTESTSTKDTGGSSVSRRLDQIAQQITRLAHLEEALLLLSRIDAGTLSLEKKEIDIFTLLVLSADNLQELFQKAGVAMEIPELGEMMIWADMDWTMEAVMNLMKNCMEHTPPGGKVYCTYEQNSLYTQIRIWDTGEGFAQEDIPHLFERFYRGKNAKNGGIGIGLALSREIIERQNGLVSARNLPEGGACFEIRFYSRGQ